MKKVTSSRAIISKNILNQVRPSPVVPNSLTESEKIEKIAEHYKEIMLLLGLDLNDGSLKKTPQRMAKMYVEDLFSGLNPASFPKVTTIQNTMGYDQMVCVKSIEVMSTCEHHFQPIEGTATIAYIPKNKVIGLSKINRIVEFFSRRPQVQERLTKQIADCLEVVLETKDIGVLIKARHFCVVARGIRDNQSVTTTSDLRGEFKSKLVTRTEFLDQC